MSVSSDGRLTFVVGTGRCGSTALSEVLNLHPDVLSISELLTSVGMDAMPDVSMPGAEFWRILGDPNPVFDAMIRGGTPLPEFLYPRSPGRFDAETTGVPALSLVVLPHLFDDPDGLLDELAQEVRSWPSRPVADQYEAFFDSLRTRFGRRVVVERSGYSLPWVPRLRERFPAARFVHLFRDGPDCAMSMSRHPGLRVILLRHRIMDRLGLGSMSDLTPEDIDALPPSLSGIFPDRFDPDVVWQPLPIAWFGQLWSRLIGNGLADLADVPESSLISVAYENLVDDPRTELTRVADFVGARPTEEWLRSARTVLDPDRRGAALQLSPDELAELREACGPGTTALAPLLS